MNIQLAMFAIGLSCASAGIAILSEKSLGAWIAGALTGFAAWAYYEATRA